MQTKVFPRCRELHLYDKSLIFWKEKKTEVDRLNFNIVKILLIGFHTTINR